MAAAIAYREATLGTPNGDDTTWSLPPITLPSGGDWRFSAHGLRHARPVGREPGHGHLPALPGRRSAALSDTLGQPQSGATFDAGKIVVTGRAEDAPDAVRQHRRGARSPSSTRPGQYMSSSRHVHQHHPELPHGVPQQPGQRRVELLLHDAGHPGRDLQRARAVATSTTRSATRPRDRGDQPRIATGVTVTQPSNLPPVPSFTYTCNQNVCTFDGRGSTDENATSLTYTWNFGTRRAPRSTAAARCPRGPSPLRARRAHRSR